MKVEDKEVAGYTMKDDEGKDIDVCHACLTEVELAGHTTDDLIMQDDLDSGTTFYCDRCGKALQSGRFPCGETGKRAKSGGDRYPS